MNTFALKGIAVILMVIDHIGLYFEDMMPFGFYLLLRSLGRLSYPLFLFCMTQGYRHTHSRKAYLLRLYLCGVFMAVFGLAADHFFPTEGFGYGNHNIFVNLLLVGVCVSTVETLQRDRRKGLWMLGGIFGVQLVYAAVSRGVPFVRQYVSGDTLTGFIPNLVLNEYSFTFVVLGVLMYFLWDRRELFCGAYLLFCIAQFSEELVWGGGGVPIQFLMALALPLMLRYNGEKGRSWKWFFYIFYPAHTFLLFYLANFVF